MPQIVCDSVRVDAKDLSRFIVQLFVAAGVSEENAELAAAPLVDSSLRGIDSHGVARVPHYLRRIRSGSVLPRPTITFDRLAPSCGIVDGGHGLGQLVMHRAAGEAVRLARDTGAGWVTVRNSSHCGALASYGQQIAAHGMIGLIFTHVDPMVLPHGARLPFCGTNPLCITAPVSIDGHPIEAFCLDMATSKTPWNSISNAIMEAIPIPLGWAVDADGNDTTCPKSANALYPVGEHKGSGLGLAIDILCSLLSDSPYGPDIPVMYGDLTKHRRLGGMIGAIDISRFVPLERFKVRLTEMLSRWVQMPTMRGCDRVLFPGEPEVLERQRRLVDGVPLGVRLVEEFGTLADAAGIPRMGLLG
ncbi:MAG: Ldh family oxidoreductase [Planctomycetia bacterium]